MGESSRLRRLVRRFAGVRVLVIGDLMLDQYVWGDVSRISPEAPVPIVRVRRQEVRAGGAGNVISNVVALGGDAAACGFVGHDPAARATTSKTRVIAHQQQVVRFDYDPDHPATPTRLARRLVSWVTEHVRKFPVVVVSDYGKGVVTAELLAALARLRERHGFVYVIDPKRPNFPHYR